MNINDLRWLPVGHRLESATVVRRTVSLDPSLVEAIGAARAVSPPVELDANARAELEARDRAEWARERDELLREPPQPVEPFAPLEVMRHLVAWASQGDGAGWRDGLARYAIERAKDDAGQAGADMLAQALRDALEGLSVALERAGDDVCGADAALVGALAKTGKCGEATGADLGAALAKARADGDGWPIWLREDLEGSRWAQRAPWAEALARCLWDDAVRALWEQAMRRAREHRPALTRGLVDGGFLPLMTGRALVRDGQVIADGGHLVATLAPTVDAALALRLASPGALDVFGRVHGHRLITHIARAVHEQKEAGHADWRAVEFEGGFSALREAIGFKDSKNDALVELLDAGAALKFASLDGPGAGAWTWTMQRASRGRRAMIKLIAGEPLTPNYIEGAYAGRGHDAREARRLIPILDDEPRLDMLNPRSQGAALTLVWLMLVELRDNAEQIVRTGALMTPDARWKALAARAGLPVELVDDVLKAWARADGGVQLIERDGQAWRLADPHKLAWEFIVEGCKREVIGRAQGLKGKAKKANRR